MTYTQISPDEYAAALLAQGSDADAPHHLAEMFVLMERGLLAATTGDVATVLGRASPPVR